MAEGPQADRFRVLSIDGGGIRGLIPARVVARLEELMSAAAGEERRVADCFHMVSGTSTGGLLALGLTAPHPSRPGRPRLTGEEAVNLYLEDGPRIFGDRLHQIASVWGWIAPKHSSTGLERALGERLGGSRLAEALREVVVTSYDMHEPGPHFFKRWRARESRERDVPIVDAGLATSAAPTYLPSHGIGEQALIDGGVFAANPTVAAVVESLKRRDDEPAALEPEELLVVSLGTGEHQHGQPQSRVRRWGRLGWVWPRNGDPALLSAFFDGQSDAAHHWAEILLNHVPGRVVADPERMGRGPRYWRVQAELSRARGLDDAGEASLAELSAAADRLLADREDDLQGLAQRLIAGGPLPPDPPRSSTAVG